MLLRSQHSARFYRPVSFADIILDDGEIMEGEWRENESNNLLHSLQVRKSGHNASINAKSVMDTFMDYFVNEGAVDWQWKYC